MGTGLEGNIARLCPVSLQLRCMQQCCPASTTVAGRSNSHSCAQGFAPLGELLAKESSDAVAEYKTTVDDLLLWMRAAASQVFTGPAKLCSGP
jgi:hypothetical protein